MNAGDDFEFTRLDLSEAGRPIVTMIAASEREVAKAARAYRRNLQTTVARAQAEVATFDEATEGDDYALKLVEGQETWPIDNYYVDRALDALTESRKRYVEAQERHAKWVGMVKGD